MTADQQPPAQEVACLWAHGPVAELSSTGLCRVCDEDDDAEYEHDALPPWMFPGCSDCEARAGGLETTCREEHRAEDAQRAVDAVNAQRAGGEQ